MKAAVLREVGKPLVIEDIAISKPRAHEVLIRTKAAGICHSDLHFIDGLYPHPLPTVPGHEAAGIVEAVGSEVRTVKPGDPVVTCLTAYCGHCEFCLTGRLSLCTSADVRRQKGDAPRLCAHDEGPITQYLNLSAFAEQMLVHEHACTRVDPDIPFDRAALLGCAVTTGMGAVIHSARVVPGETVAVIGCGGVGLATINGAAIAGAGRIIAIDRQPAKLALATQFGATDVVDAGTGDPVQQVLTLTKGGVHHSFEAVGLKETAEQAFQMLRRGGTATIIGMIPPGVHIALHGPEFLAEKKIQGSFIGSSRLPVDAPRLVDFYLRGRLKLDAMIARRLRLAEINQGIDELRTGASARSVILFDD